MLFKLYAVIPQLQIQGAPMYHLNAQTFKWYMRFIEAKIEKSFTLFTMSPPHLRNDFT
jgi:hypothetical protein